MKFYLEIPNVEGMYYAWLHQDKAAQVVQVRLQSDGRCHIPSFDELDHTWIHDETENYVYIDETPPVIYFGPLPTPPTLPETAKAHLKEAISDFSDFHGVYYP